MLNSRTAQPPMKTVTGEAQPNASGLITIFASPLLYRFSHHKKEARHHHPETWSQAAIVSVSKI
jgi:fructoselysine-6-P-deglycase FrlB-like protein